jgi:hypothetical protein
LTRSDHAAVRRPLGVTVISISCFIGSLWSFAAAGLHGLFVGDRLIPLYPPLMTFQSRQVQGGHRWVGVTLHGGQEIVGILLVGVLLLILGILLWRMMRFAHLGFLAVLWVGVVFNFFALYASNYWLVGAMLYRDLSQPMKLLILATPVLLLAVMVLLSVVLWRHRALFR